MSVIIVVPRSVISCCPLLNTIWIVLYRGIVIACSAAVAISGNIDITQGIHSNGICNIIRRIWWTRRACVSCHPKPSAGWIILDSGIILTSLGAAVTISRHVDIAESIKCDGFGAIIIITRPVIFCHPPAAAISIVFNRCIIKATLVVITLASYINIPSFIHSHGKNKIITISRTIIPCYPLLDSIWIILYRGIVGAGSVAIAISRHVNVTESIHGNGYGCVMIISGAVISCHPLLDSIWVILCCGVILVTATAMTMSCYIDIAQIIHNHRFGMVIVISRTVIPCHPLLNNVNSRKSARKKK